MGITIKTVPLWAMWSLSSLLLASSVDAAKLVFSVNDAPSGSLYKESADLACNSATHVLDISGTYDVGGGNSFKIEAIDNTATARLTCDEAADILTLKHAKLSIVSGTINNVKIAFWRTYTGATVAADYSVSGNGAFGGTPNGAWLALRGYVGNTSLGNLAAPANPPTCADPMNRCASASPGTWLFNSTTFKQTHNLTPTDPRDLKGQFWFKLVAGSNLTFTTAKGIQIKFGAPPGQDSDKAKGKGKGKGKEKVK